MKDSTRDRAGKEVCVGDTVKVLVVDRALLDSLRGDELRLAESMRGALLPVIEVFDGGYAVVEKEVRSEDGSVLSQTISLAPSEMEKQAL